MDTRTICRNCHGGCAVECSLEHAAGRSSGVSRLTRVQPWGDSPFNRAQMCVKGFATPEMVHHPDRLTRPLKRVGDRGAGRWQAVDWDTALDGVAHAIRRLQDRHGPEALALGQGTGRHYYLHVLRFAHQLGAPNWYEPGLANCFIPRITVSNLTYGGFVCADYYGEVAPKTILFWGHNPLVSGPDGELSFPASAALRHGASGICVDPRRSETAKQCSLWLPIRPGTDAALALAMAHVIVYDELYDKEFVTQWTSGFEGLKAHLEPYTPGWAETVTRVDAGMIVEAARRYALDRPAVLEWGVAIEQTPNSLQTTRALALLRGLTGNIDVPGADILGMRHLKPYPVLKQALPPAMLKKRIGAQEFKLLGGMHAFMPSAHIPGLFNAMLTGDPYPVRGLLLFGNNPLATVANARKVRRALLGLDLLVATELFMTPSAALADWVLPSAMWPEIEQIFEAPFVAGEAVFANRKLMQVGECRQCEEIMIDLARRLDLPGADADLHDLLDEQLKPLGVHFKELQERFVIHPPHEYRKFEQRGFRTRSRKVELYSKTLERLGYAPFPEYREPPESPLATPELARDFPCTLVTGPRRREFFCSEHRQIPSLRARRPDPLAEMHPTSAARFGVQDGAWVDVVSPRGRATFRARVTEDILEDVVSVDHGWWFPEREGPEHGVFDSNANVLTNDGPPYDPAFGSYQLRALLCRVEPAESQA